jgi:hypothetical protein
LRLIQAGEVRVNAKTRQPTPGALTAIGKVLLDGDFYRPEDQSKEKGDPGASDLGIQVYAWPFLVQAAGLATAAGTHLQLTAKGQKALLAPAQELIQTVWTKWQPSALLDEFSRISGIKGQQSKGRFLTALVPRRKAVVDVLRQCPVHKWIRIDDLFRFLKITAQEFKVANQERKLRVSTDYTRQGFIGIKKWENLEGRYVLVLLFEYLATLGLVDVAYIHPTGARADFEETYWSDDLVSLSRYDGLRSVRINALGAWCLGLAADYEPEVVSVPRDLLVLPNHDVVVNVQPIDPEVVLVLDRYAVRKSGPVWALEQGKILSAVEEGLTIRELQDFLTSRSQTPLP